MTKRASEQSDGLTTLGSGFGNQKIADAFGFRQVKFAVHQRPTRELPGLGVPESVHAAKDAQNRITHRDTAVEMQFDHVFTGETGRRVEAQNDCVIDRFRSIRLFKPLNRCCPRGWLRNGKLAETVKSPESRDPYNRKA